MNTDTFTVFASGITPQGELFSARAIFSTVKGMSEADVTGAMREAALLSFASWPEIEFTCEKIKSDDGRMFAGVSCPTRHLSNFTGLLETAAVFTDSLYAGRL